MKITNDHDNDEDIPNRGRGKTNNDFKDVLKQTIIGVDIANGKDVAVTSYVAVCNATMNLIPVDKKEKKHETRRK